MISSINKTTLREQVLEQLRGAILNGEISPGTHLSEVALAQSFGVSRGTIREALRTLEQARMLENAPRGLQVRIMPSKEIADLYQTRTALERLAIETVMSHENAETIIQKLTDALPPAEGSTQNFSNIMDLDLAFHRMLVESCNNDVLLRLWEELQEQIHVAILNNRHKVQDLMTREYHEPILKEMASGNIAKASQHLADHMMRAANRLTQEE